MPLHKLSLLTTATNQPLAGPKGPKDYKMIEVKLHILYQSDGFTKPHYQGIVNIVNFKNAVSFEHMSFWAYVDGADEQERGSVTFEFSLDDAHLIPKRIELAKQYLALFDCTIEESNV